jgi:hypothetical protein
MVTMIRPERSGRPIGSLLARLYCEFKYLVAKQERLRAVEVQAREALEAAQDREWCGTETGLSTPAFKAWRRAHQDWTAVRMAIGENHRSRQRELLHQQSQQQRRA